MKYIIMAGGNYTDKFSTPKPLQKVAGEVLIERTIKLLKNNGIDDIGISTNNPMFEYLGIELLHHNNDYIHGDTIEHKKSQYSWLNAFYPMEEPCCYLFGDVYYTDNAIKTIINTKVKDTMFFCIRDKQDGRTVANIKGREPLGFKIQNAKLFRDAINDMLQMVDDGKFENYIAPFSWHVYRYLNGLNIFLKDWGELNNIFDKKGDYITIDDLTCDIDNVKDISRLEYMLGKGGKMIKVEVIEEFTLGDYKLLKNIQRYNPSKNDEGRLYVKDTFECDENMVKYLTGDNKYKTPYVKVLEIIPAEVIEEKPVEEDLDKVNEEEIKVVKPKKKRKK